MRKVLIGVFTVLLASNVWAADIAIEHNSSYTTVAHTTTTDENRAALYYHSLYDDNLCREVGLADGCSKAQYTAAGGTERFYDRTVLGAKEFFMEQVIEKSLDKMVSDYERDLNQRARNIWTNELDVAAKESSCVSWGKNSDCTEP